MPMQIDTLPKPFILCLIICFLSVSSPPTANDPWGAPSAPTDAVTTSDPFGDGGITDPWLAPSENGTYATVSVCLCCCFIFFG